MDLILNLFKSLRRLISFATVVLNKTLILGEIYLISEAISILDDFLEVVLETTIFS